MSHYTITQIDDQTYQICDSLHDTMYLLLGTKQAMLIDCGMDEEELYPTLRALTDLPIVVFFTHGHLDHVGRGNEFETVYMDRKDDLIYLNNYKGAPQLFYKPIEKILDINFEEYNLGNRVITIIPLYGHTPGSIILVDKNNHQVFTGDAIGSGCGVWMQVNLALALDNYSSNIEQAYKKLINLGCDESWKFYGGHAGQEYASKVSDYNPLDIHLLYNMKELCDRLMNGQNDYTVSTSKSFIDQCYYASYKKAEMEFTLPQISSCKIDLVHAQEVMDHYLAQFDLDNDKINLKKIHTYEVMNTSTYIAKRENLNIEDIRLAKLIALLHDIGRFEQIKRFNCFEDSKIDHAKLALEILFDHHMIREFIETDEYDQIIYEAIYNHSLYAIEKVSSDRSKLHSMIIRDSDKLDNFRVKNVELIPTLFDITVEEFEQLEITPFILEEIKNHHLIKKEDRKNYLDRWVSFLAFVFDLNMNSSYIWLKESNYINRNIERFHYASSKEMEIISKELNTYLDTKVAFK